VKPNSILLAVVAVILIISLVCIWLYPSIQDLAAANNMWNGIKKTTSELHAETITSLDDLPDVPQNTGLIVIPNKDYSDEEMARLQQFVEGGGRLVLMDQRRLPGLRPPASLTWTTTVHGRRVSQKARSR